MSQALAQESPGREEAALQQRPPGIAGLGEMSEALSTELGPSPAVLTEGAGDQERLHQLGLSLGEAVGRAREVFRLKRIRRAAAVVCLAGLMVSCTSTSNNGQTSGSSKNNNPFAFLTASPTPGKTPASNPHASPSKHNPMDLLPPAASDDSQLDNALRTLAGGVGELFGAFTGPASTETVTAQTKGDTGIPFILPLLKDPLVVTSGYGERLPPVNGASSNHLALDLQANPDDQVRNPAPDGGVVEFAGARSGYGNIIIVQSHAGNHPGQVAHILIAHINPDPALQRNVLLGPGQYLGKVAPEGENGKATGPHIHFEVTIQRPGQPETHADPTNDLCPHGLAPIPNSSYQRCVR